MAIRIVARLQSPEGDWCRCDLLQEKPYLAGGAVSPANPTRSTPMALDDAIRSGDLAAINRAWSEMLKRLRNTS